VGAVERSHDSEELNMQAITTIGLDIAKSVFQVHCIDAAGNVLVRIQLKRRSRNREKLFALSGYAIADGRRSISVVDLQNLGLQSLGTKRLDDIAANPQIPGLNNFVYRGIGSHHDEGQVSAPFVCAYPPK
jgi:hypothetical protein